MEIDIMSFKIVVDSCCELPEEYLQDPRFEIVPLGLEVGDYRIQDDENFDQAEFLKRWRNLPNVPSLRALPRRSSGRLIVQRQSTYMRSPCHHT